MVAEVVRELAISLRMNRNLYPWRGAGKKMAESAGRFCPDCGHPVGLYDRFCRSCAYSLVTPPAGEGRGGAEVKEGGEAAQEAAERRSSWWQRMFGSAGR